MADRSNSSAIRVLVVEDNPADADLVRITLAEHAPDAFTVAHARKLSIALEQLARHAYDVVLLDLGLPDTDGLETLDRFRKVRPDTPVVVLTGRSDRTVGLAALERGANGYVLKGWDHPDELLGCIRTALGRRRTLEDLAAVTDRMRSAEARLKRIQPSETRPKKP
jgi:DNA-binding NarL/FixJ family response regulator